MRMKLRTPLASLALLMLAAPPAAAQELGTYRQFRDWMAGCDNTRSCRAYALQQDIGEPEVALGIDRAGEANAEPQLFLHFRDQDISINDRRVTIRSETREIASLTVGRGLQADDAIFRITDRQVVAAILAETRRAKELRLQLDPRPEGFEPEGVRISLDGAAAALLWIDDRQKRVGTVTALARPGDRPASTVVRPPALPPAPVGRPAAGGPAPETLPAATMNAVMAAFRRIPGEDCNQDDPERDGPSIDRLGPNLLLVGVRCWRGAYNFSRAYFLVDEGPRPNVRPARFPRQAVIPRAAEDGPEPSDTILWNADFSAQDGGISHFSKGRGIGDCGETGSWTWDGRAFRPVVLTQMPKCRGILAGYWFTLYRTQEGRAP